MYHSAINERSQMKIELQVAHNKLQKSLARQQILEKKFEQQRKKNEQLEIIVLQLRNEFVKMQKKREAEKENALR